MRDGFWTVADDETVLVGTSAPGIWDRRIVLLGDVLPEQPAERKRRKPDFESIAVLPGDRLLVLGSGSKAARRRGVVVDLRTHVVARIDLAPLYLALESALPELNVEGAVVHGGALLLAQRGNGSRDSTSRSTNALVRLDLVRVLQSLMDGGIGADALESIEPVELPSLDGVPLGLTDLASSGAALYFTAAAEDTASTYDDGPCRGSVVGRLSAAGRVETLRPIEGRAKLEGLAVQPEAGDGLRAWLVADADDRAVPARLLRLDALELD